MVVKVISRSRAHLPACSGARRTHGPSRLRQYLLAGLAATALALAACSSSTSPDGAANHAKVVLFFDVNHGPGTTVTDSWTLNCEPAAGTMPGAADACTALLKLKHPFAPQPSGVACPMILLSNKKIVVTGTWFGTRVHRVVVDGGCDIALFSKLTKLFG
jgi:subtilisin inhibitor-like